MDMLKTAPRPKLKLLLGLLLAAAIRLAFLIVTSNQEFLAIDGRNYQDISSNLAAGKGYSISFYPWFEPEPAGAFSPRHPDFFRPPLLPIIEATLYKLPGPWLLRAGPNSAGGPQWFAAGARASPPAVNPHSPPTFCCGRASTRPCDEC
jgi:hypothetical protein